MIPCVALTAFKFVVLELSERLVTCDHAVHQLWPLQPCWAGFFLLLPSSDQVSWCCCLQQSGKDGEGKTMGGRGDNGSSTLRRLH